MVQCCWLFVVGHCIPLWNIYKPRRGSIHVALSIGRLIKLSDDRIVEYRPMIYVGKYGGKYWYIVHNYVKYMVREGRKRTMRIWCRISDALRDKTLWQSLPREVRQTIVQIYGEPTFNTVRKSARIIKLPVRKLVCDLKFVQDVLLEVGTLLEGMHLCYRCRNNIMPQLVEIVDKFRQDWGIEPNQDETPQEYVSKLIDTAIGKIGNILTLINKAKN